MLAALVEQYKLGAHIELLKELSRLCWLGIPSSQPIGLGSSKVGGLPHADKTFTWPKFQGTPLEFVAQINLGELQASILPSSGLLLFFYADGVFTDKKADKDFIRVIYIRDIYNLEVKYPEYQFKKRLFGLLKPHKIPRIFSEHRLEFCQSASLPDLDNVDEIPSLAIFDNCDELLDSYCELKWGLTKQAVLQIGGYPNPVQYDGIAAGAASIMQKGNGHDWQLLLEVDSKLGFMWGDAGRLYFSIHKDDLKAAQFSDVWMDFQCH